MIKQLFTVVTTALLLTSGIALADGTPSTARTTQQTQPARSVPAVPGGYPTCGTRSPRPTSIPRAVPSKTK